MRAARFVLWCFTIAALLGGCSTHTARDAPREVVFEGAAALPTASARDWATYGDYVVSWTARSARRIAPTKTEVDRGEGTIGRQVSVSIDQVVWIRKDAPSLSRLPKTMNITNGGWIFHGDKEHPWRVDGQTKLQVGQKYLALLTYADLTLTGEGGTPAGPEWIALDFVPVSGGVIAGLSSSELNNRPMRSALMGRTVDMTGKMLDSTAADPIAKPFMNVDPVLRYQKVRDVIDAQATSRPGPGPGER